MSYTPSRAAALASAIALILLGLAWELWLAPTGSGTIALKVLPLVLALPGLLRGRLYTYRWCSLVAWAYVAEGLVRGTSERGIAVPLSVSEVALALAFFTACVLQIRVQTREAAP